MSLKPIIKILKNEEGVTLVELLAAITILALIVTAFLAFFIQGGKANQMTDEKNVATFIAVEEMEQITNLSQQGQTFDKVKTNYLKQNSGYNSSKNTDSQLEVTTSRDGYKVTLNVMNKLDNEENPTNLYHVFVTVEGGGNDAEMQSILPFKE